MSASIRSTVLAATDDDLGRFDDTRVRFAASVAAVYPDADAETIRHAVAGSIKRLDAAKLSALVRAARPDRVLEVGSFLGFSTRILLDATAENAATVVSVDPRVRHRVFDDPLRHVVAFNPDDRLECRTAFFGSRLIEPMLHDYVSYEPRVPLRRARRLLEAVDTITEPFDEFDFVFIDGDHSYAATMGNIALALRMLRPGGVVVVHDALTWPAVRPAAVDVVAAVPGVELIGVTSADTDRFFVDDEPGWRRPITAMRDRLVGSPADGLCVLGIDAATSADLDRIRTAAARIDDDLVAEGRRRRARELGHERPRETDVGKLVRRGRSALTDPRGFAKKISARTVPGGPGRRGG